MCGRINYICNELNHDRAYHLLHKNADEIIVCIDIDHIYDESIFFLKEYLVLSGNLAMKTIVFSKKIILHHHHQGTF